MRPWILILVPSASWAAPVELTWQGRLLDATGLPLEGSHTLRVRLWDHATGTDSVEDLLFSQDFSVTTQQGYASVVLGSTGGLDSAALAGDVWVGVTIDPPGGSELAPRSKITDLPSAATASTSLALPTASASPSGCSGGANVGAMYFDTGLGAMRVCNGTSWGSVGSGGGTSPGSNPSFGPVQTLFYTGTNQTFTVPAGVTSIDVKLWGAGGGGTAQLHSSGNPGGQGGGAGGFASGTISVIPGEVLTVIVGGGGAASGEGGFGGGGNGGKDSTSAFGAGGGGRTAIRRSTGVEILTAGGGGGSSIHGTGCSGGNGGGSTAGVGSNCQSGTSQTSGGGGTQSTGGAAGNSYGFTGSAGTQYTGGAGGYNGTVYGAGGGGGWYGGGGGPPTSPPGHSCSGGGGSGYVGGAGVTAGVNLGSASPTACGGSTNLPPMTGDADYLTGTATGGALTANGGHGLAVIRWAGSAPTAPSTSANTAHGVQPLAFSGTNNTFTVPTGVTAIEVKLWGAAGGGIGQPGGPGGYTTAVIAVTPGEPLTVIVGGSGKASGSAGFGGGGAGGSGVCAGGGGGGRTAILRGLTELATAGGGGGAINHGSGFSGGPGGGFEGGIGTNANSTTQWSGGGGTQTAGGRPGNSYGNIGQAGGPLTGGNGPYNGCFGGGGGGGWYGGGSGAGTSPPGHASGGGGGSGYVRGPGVFGTTFASGTTPTGAGPINPPGVAESDYVTYAANAGKSFVGDGNNGFALIRW